MNPILEKFLIAACLGFLGLLTGVIAWWFLTPALSIPLVVFKMISMALGAIFFIYGFYNPDNSVDILGGIWRFLWRLSSQVLRYITLFRK